MPLLGSITYQVADIHPVTAVREIAHTPSDWRTIVREHAQVRALLHHQDRLKRMAETLESLEKQEGLNGLDSRRAELVERARLEIDRQLKELGLDPQLTTQLPTTTATRRTERASEGRYSTDLRELMGSMRSRTGLTNSCTSSAKAMVATAAIT